MKRVLKYLGYAVVTVYFVADLLFEIGGPSAVRMDRAAAHPATAECLD